MDFEEKNNVRLSKSNILSSIEDAIPFNETSAEPIRHIYKAYCTSLMCSNGVNTVFKGIVYPKKPDKMTDRERLFYRKPFACPDCDSALFWRKIPMDKTLFNS